jgi:hypothetical protein
MFRSAKPARDSDIRGWRIVADSSVVSALRRIRGAGPVMGGQVSGNYRQMMLGRVEAGFENDSV